MLHLWTLLMLNPKPYSYLPSALSIGYPNNQKLLKQALLVLFEAAGACSSLRDSDKSAFSKSIANRFHTGDKVRLFQQTQWMHLRGAKKV